MNLLIIYLAAIALWQVVTYVFYRWDNRDSIYLKADIMMCIGWLLMLVTAELQVWLWQ